MEQEDPSAWIERLSGDARGEKELRGLKKLFSPELGHCSGSTPPLCPETFLYTRPARRRAEGDRNNPGDLL
jgi:hypothetical protein